MALCHGSATDLFPSDGTNPSARTSRKQRRKSYSHYGAAGPSGNRAVVPIPRVVQPSIIRAGGTKQMTQGSEKTKNNKSSPSEIASGQTLSACACRWCDEISDHIAKIPLSSLALAVLGGMGLGLLTRSCCCRRCGGSGAENSSCT